MFCFMLFFFCLILEFVLVSGILANVGDKNFGQKKRQCKTDPHLKESSNLNAREEFSFPHLTHQLILFGFPRFSIDKKDFKF
jgi:hypothetical protein